MGILRAWSRIGRGLLSRWGRSLDLAHEERSCWGRSKQRLSCGGPRAAPLCKAGITRAAGVMRGHQGTEESPSPHMGAVRVGVREVFWAAKMQDLKEGFKDESKLSRQRREWWWGAYFTCTGAEVGNTCHVQRNHIGFLRTRCVHGVGAWDGWVMSGQVGGRLGPCAHHHKGRGTSEACSSVT